ncbi:MAG: hypothetical protein H6Q26_586 [Bacteroidetes bacterium]|nr:hypothetical protein [Bacteroidota bacterium]
MNGYGFRRVKKIKIISESRGWGVYIIYVIFFKKVKI